MMKLLLLAIVSGIVGLAIGWSVMAFQPTDPPAPKTSKSKSPSVMLFVIPKTGEIKPHPSSG